MSTYYTWTIGCQMNKAESQQLANHLEKLGYKSTPNMKKADVIIVNTCVVRQSAEDKVTGLLSYLKGIKNNKSDLKIVVTGCFVDSEIDHLYKKYPHISLFFKPGYYNDFYSWGNNNLQFYNKNISSDNINLKSSAFSVISIIQGCNNYCSYCIVPYRRGREISRTKEDIITELRTMAQNGIKEVTLTGQNVNSYGKDLYQTYSLIDLLRDVNNIDGLLRIRFLTNHPKDMENRLIDELGSLEKVCKHINIPVQSGNNEILKLMNRHYTRDNYLRMIEKLKKLVPAVSLSTDIIVGFPGETEHQFLDTLDIIKQVEYDVVHVAMYSPRKGTVAYKKYPDNISQEEKKRRFSELEAIQKSIAININSRLNNENVSILVEGKKNNKWFGRTESNKLVFFEHNKDLTGQEIELKINRTTAWSLQAEIIK
jgi:tRNA-2-methylthio-N6-dimethylallyladenosine synthase